MQIMRINRLTVQSVSTVSIAYVTPVPYQINFYLVNTNS